MACRTLLRPAMTAGRILPAMRVGPSSIKSRQRHVRLMSCLTLSLDPSRASLAELKEAAIDGVEEHVKREPPIRSRRENENDGLVILASRTLAPLLDDDGFIARLISSTGHVLEKPKAVSVLTAAVDEVPTYDHQSDAFCSAEGLSILRGSAARVLPRHLREEALIQGAKPSIEFSPPRARFTGPLRVTVPLANTIFTNGKTHSLTESLWETGQQKPPRLQHRVQKTKAEVVIPATDMGFGPKAVSAIMPGLVPITEPSKILSSFGNILRQISLGGPSGASTELERIIPPITQLSRRTSGPLEVWALILPPEYVAKGLPLPRPIPSEPSAYNIQHEQYLAQRTATLMGMLLAGGCRLHKVLSGGGGWGKKKGLLSLDTETKFGPSEEDDLDSFINSFNGISGPAAEGGELADRGQLTGSYVQFLTQAAYPTPELHSNLLNQRWNPNPAQPTEPTATPDAPSPTTVFGTPGAPTVSPPTAVAAKAWQNLFGGFSSEGFFLETSDPQSVDAAVATKINAPRSCLISARTHESDWGSRIQGNLYQDARVGEIDESWEELGQQLAGSSGEEERW
ncbi:hypothetical protein VTK26DRAFT_9396 [Humicola hyalothermophila]